MTFMPEEMPLYDSRIQDRQLMPGGLWLVIQVHVYKPGNMFKLQVTWRRAGEKRKGDRAVKLKPIVLPVRPHDPQPYVSDDWIYGVRDKEVYGILLDIDHHGFRHNSVGVELSFVTEPIEVLDILAGV